MLNAENIRIAIIEDDEDDYIIIKDYISEIEGKSFVVDWYNDYSDGIEKIKSRSYDLYFVDYFLGLKTGLDLLEEAAALKCDDPIVLLTGLGNKKIDVKAMEMGATDYLVKSDLTTEKLERCIRYSLERASFLRELKARETKYRNLFEGSKDAVFIGDDNLNFIEVNDAALNLLDGAKEHLVGRNLIDFISESKQKGIINLIQHKKGNIENAEIKVVNDKKESKDCLLSLTYQQQGADQKATVHGIIHDITQIKKAELANLQAEKLEANERLIRMLAHEIRNPLNNIILSIDQLIQGGDDDSQSTYMGIIQRNSLRINNIITELLNLAKPSELTFGEFSIQEIMEESLSATSDRIKLQKVNVEKNYGPELLHINADKSKLAIAFTNIIINAIEAMDTNGSLKINITSGDDSYDVYIKDNGRGIPPEYLSKLFEPFFTMKKNGMGLGLTASYSIIQSHNAKIRVLSPANEGTVFHISFKK
jgi:PAS domain S-box-containing protein